MEHHVVSKNEQTSDQIRFAVIGCGSIAENYHLPAMQNIGGFSFVLACDLIESRTQLFADKFGADRQSLNYLDAVASEDVDLVCIFTKVDSHAEIAIAAANAGKHIFLQKPLARSLEEGNKIHCAVRSNGVQLVSSFMHSYFPESLEASKWVRNGRIGRVELIRQRNATGNPRDVVASYGGAIIDIGAHGIALVRDITGQDIVRLVATVDSNPTSALNSDNLDAPLNGDELNAVILYELSGGIMVTHEVQYAQRGGTERFQTEIYGDKGSILLRVPRTGEAMAVSHLRGMPDGENRHFDWTIPKLDQSAFGQAHHEAVLAAIQDNSRELEDDTGMAVLRVCDAIRRSISARGWVDLQRH
jgi:UDP-N-acetylglucosamine 3-dehydrogenase